MNNLKLLGISNFIIKILTIFYFGMQFFKPAYIFLINMNYFFLYLIYSIVVWLILANITIEIIKFFISKNLSKEKQLYFLLLPFIFSYFEKYEVKFHIKKTIKS
ncbi:hypothetical protein [[Mycoplasma] collis]|uniref:hypothetical protein n=1 Tax=[Mycoplasma] collis TaxID=2127 RepID=UPI00051AC481|nr:hypothetical protein [[Mycoplasma] collis]